ncbi:hypothetical protein OJF2_47860 [Aquisphaera giovannonii]|uniref:Uncharacterized protein n=1 Tax=Aquisphaera giovannonii TaxID=406548 RepID=A0A5B9W6D1_9BACT|nr:TIGR03067 domain-containing protein [Aquisphaera giovannonii]QEH36226.1 hypothetical protein OJF2_47860 [Aquisphaera giovannonii]
MIDTELPPARGPATADRALDLIGTGFTVMASLCLLGGAIGLLATCRDLMRTGGGPDEAARTALALAIPAILGVVPAWLLVRVGQGLRARRPGARRAAVVCLAAACLPFQTLAAESLLAREAGWLAAVGLEVPFLLALSYLMTPGAVSRFFPKGSPPADGPGARRSPWPFVAIMAAVTVVPFLGAQGLRRAARADLEAARDRIARGEWEDAKRLLDRALLLDGYLVDAALPRARAIDGLIASGARGPSAGTRAEALRDLDWYLRHHPRSGEAHYQRGLALAGDAKVEPARAAFATAIPLMDDPTPALVERAGLSFHVGKYAEAAGEVSEAIARHPLLPDLYESRQLYRRMAGDLPGASRDAVRAGAIRERPGLSAEAMEAIVEARGRPIAADQAAPRVAAERARLLGRWDVVERETDGESVDTTDRDFSLVFRPDGYRMVLDGKLQQDAPYRLDPDANPARIDWTAEAGGETVRLLGLYRLEGDRLTIRMGRAGSVRPEAFAGGDAFEPPVTYSLRRSAVRASSNHPAG